MTFAVHILDLCYEIGFVYHTTYADERASLNNPRINQLYTLEWWVSSNQRAACRITLFHSISSSHHRHLPHPTTIQLQTPPHAEPETASIRRWHQMLCEFPPQRPYPNPCDGLLGAELYSSENKLLMLKLEATSTFINEVFQQRIKQWWAQFD